MPSRRNVLRRCSIPLCLGVAGCSGDSSNGDDGNSTSSPSATGTPSGVSDEEAKDRALSAEETFLRTQLRNETCLADWGIESPVGSKEATIAERAANGVRVNVTRPYWYSTETDESDSISQAQYVISDDDQRVRGDDVSPC